MTRLVKKAAARNRTTVSPKHQVTIPRDALRAAGLKTGDRLRAEPKGAGRVLLIREDDPVARYAGALTGLYGPGYLDQLRREWR
ncbi:MAG: AbrB/MazE/SpoVT family DNA-binding domain-containing protein [Chloroflexota bacterium]